MSRFVMTLDDGVEPTLEEEKSSDDEVVEEKKGKAAKRKKKKAAVEPEPPKAMNPDFVFDEDEDDNGADWNAGWHEGEKEDDLKFYSDKQGSQQSVASLIEKSKQEFASDGESSDSDDDAAAAVGKPTPITTGKRRRTDDAPKSDAKADDDEGGNDGEGGEDGEDGEDGKLDVEAAHAAAAAAAEARKKEYFADAPEGSEAASFAAMDLSRPLLRGLQMMKFEVPSLVQQRAIPIALMGRDLCVCASTGSGKTAAFMLPVLERLLFRPKMVAQTRVLVLLPTRELALQCLKMAKNFAKATDIQFSLAVGGMPLRAQEAELRLRPDVVIATPGRLVDHITNTMSFSLDEIEVLILDEADRLLDVGFRDELESIIGACPRARQTMLFSATMTDEVEDLVALSLHEPIRLFVNKNTKVNTNLTQEFVRVRQNRENCREAIVLALCARVFTTKCLVFVRAKTTAHRLRVIMGLAGLKATELHGSLTQAQRIEALDLFTNDAVDFMVCTDLAGRGLDIPGVAAVINMTMPHTLQQYIHRVGRTARAGREGSSITLVGENERKLLKEIVKTGEGDMKSRVIPPKTIEKYRQKIMRMKEAIKNIFDEEKVNKELDQVDMEMTKAQNMIDHKAEIASRPKREWISSGREKTANQKLSLDAHTGGKGEDGAPGLSKAAKANVAKMEEADAANRKRAKPMIDPAVAAQIRQIKRNKKPKRITVHTPERQQDGGGKKKKRAVGFETDIRPGVSRKAVGGGGGGYAGKKGGGGGGGGGNKHKGFKKKN